MQSKLAGENKIKNNFTNSYIFRPSVIFGHDDKFFNRFASLAEFSPALPMIGGGKSKFQPVYVGDVAEAILKMNASKRMQNWKNKVLTLNEGFNLKPAKIKEGILPSIQDSLWKGVQIKAKYTSVSSNKAKEYILHPVGLVYRGRISYLICSFDKYKDDFSYLALHRF